MAMWREAWECFLTDGKAALPSTAPSGCLREGRLHARGWGSAAEVLGERSLRHGPQALELVTSDMEGLPSSMEAPHGRSNSSEESVPLLRSAT